MENDRSGHHLRPVWGMVVSGGRMLKHVRPLGSASVCWGLRSGSVVAKGLKKKWRRDRDSNPGYLAVYTLSKRAPSATRPSLRGIAGLFESNTVGLRPEGRPIASKTQGACAAMFCFTIADDFRSTGTPCIR